MPRRLLRLVLPSPDGRRVLARPNGLAGWILPAIATDDATAWTGAEDDAATRALGAPTAPVRRLDDRTWLLEPRGRVPAVGTTWIAPADAGRLGADADVVRRWAAGHDEPPSAHLRAGWRTEVESWVAEVVPGADVDRINVLRHWELAAVLAVPTAEGAAVVKEPGAGFAPEADVVATLAGLPGAPELLAAADGRFVTRWAGSPAAATPAAVARTCGALQRGARGRVADLRAAGCADVAELVAGAGAAVDRALAQLAALGLPDSVVHGDAHGANAVGSAGRVVLVDWSDATVGCPAIDLDLLVGHHSSGEGPAGGGAGAVVAAWADGHGCDASPIVDALPAVRIVAAALAVALHRAHRPQLPATIHPWWDRWTAEWETRLAQLVG